MAGLSQVIESCQNPGLCCEMSGRALQAPRADFRARTGSWGPEGPPGHFAAQTKNLAEAAWTSPTLRESRCERSRNVGQGTRERVQSRTGLRTASWRFLVPALRAGHGTKSLNVFAAPPPTWGQVELASKRSRPQAAPGLRNPGCQGLRPRISCSWISYSCPGLRRARSRRRRPPGTHEYICRTDGSGPPHTHTHTHTHTGGAGAHASNTSHTRATRVKRRESCASTLFPQHRGSSNFLSVNGLIGRFRPLWASTGASGRPFSSSACFQQYDGSMFQPGGQSVQQERIGIEGCR